MRVILQTLDITNITNSPVTPNTILTDSPKTTNIETLSAFNAFQIFWIKTPVKIVEVQLSALKSFAIDAFHKKIAFFQNELTEKNKMIKSQMETQAAVLDVMTELG